MTDPNYNEPTPKIIVDDDWKSQVQAEKEELKKKEAEAQETESDSSSEASAAPVDSAAGQSDDAMPELPPASIMMLITTLGAQAMSALGFMPDPSTGQTSKNRPLAKHLIDTLGLLEEKTKGNLTDEESGYLAETLHQLRMAFVTPPEQAE